MLPLALPIRFLPRIALVAAAWWAPASLLAVPLAFAAMTFLMQAYWSARIAFYVKLRDAIATTQSADLANAARVV